MQMINKLKSDLSSGRFWSYFLLFSLLLLNVFSCANEAVQKSFEAEKNAFGKINRVNVLCDKDVWEGPLGDSIRFYYGAAYPILPQPEPIFDLRHITLEDLRKDPLRKELRTYIVVGNLADQDSETTALILKDVGLEKIRAASADNGYGNSVARNKWAKGQTIVYLYADSEEKLIDNITNSFSAVAKRLHQADEKIIDATAFFNGENVSLASEINALMGVKMRIPEEFKPAMKEAGIVWLRRETSEASSNIILQKIPYTDQAQLSREGIKAIRNEMGKTYVSSTLPDTYMRINDVDLPLIVETTRVNGDYALEARGIWDIVNDFMGGAFISYLVYDPGKKELLFMDAFVHAPGKEKRDLMQQLDYILNTAQY
ncbi:DUF4837 family protein [Lewinella sp. LCG006]|uniref:DUF4837 family protein n=1 Tax=Lewinella sp. LCG006 TaxID=3231911 RepID=UPI00345F29CC